MHKIGISLFSMPDNRKSKSIPLRMHRSSLCLDTGNQFHFCERLCSCHKCFRRLVCKHHICRLCMARSRVLMVSQVQTRRSTLCLDNDSQCRFCERLCSCHKYFRLLIYIFNTCRLCMLCNRALMVLPTQIRRSSHLLDSDSRYHFFMHLCNCLKCFR